MARVGIYYILCDGKYYIGKSKDIDRRIKQHISEAMNKVHLHNGLHKAMAYSDWSWGIIEMCPQRSLNKREQYWIEHFDTYNTGWNRTMGGDTSPQSSARYYAQKGPRR